MRISELLTVMGNLSVGNDNVTPFERTIFLQYLNLAHLELFQETANFNQDLVEIEILDREPEGVAAFPAMPYVVVCVYDVGHKRKLERLSQIDAIDPVCRSQSGTGMVAPSHYVIHKKTIQFIPAPTVAITVLAWYIPQPQSLTLETEERDIPYPIAYHPVLVDGALYYLFQEEGGFKSSQKELEAKIRWEKGKSRLLSYLYSASGQTLSTFSNA